MSFVKRPPSLQEYREQRRAWIVFQVDERGKSFAEIARLLGIHPATVGREYQR